MTRDIVLGTHKGDYWGRLRPIGTVLSVTPQPNIMVTAATFEFQLAGRSLVIDVIQPANLKIDDLYYVITYPDDSTFSFYGRVKEERLA